MTDVNEPEFWEEIYKAGRTGWDLGEPTPIFRRLLETGQLPRGRMIVLGAGRGHDARLFAGHGFKVTAVDFADEAVRALREHADPAAPIEVVQADLFDLPERLVGAFDIVLEYTCFCAIDPARRADYADVVTGLVRPGGHYVGLLFPTWTREGGPPFAVSAVQLLGLFRERGWALSHWEQPGDSVPPRAGLEELVILYHRTENTPHPRSPS